jgi:hypothetical protein
VLKTPVLKKPVKKLVMGAKERPTEKTVNKTPVSANG